jgi:hypothetical protein
VLLFGTGRAVELTPVTPLEPSTRYEVATVDASKVPPNRVSGTFTTGRTTDTTAPRIDAMGPAIAVGSASSCAITGAREVYCWGSWPHAGGAMRKESLPVKMRLE